MKIFIFNSLLIVLAIVLDGNGTYSANILGIITDHSRSHCIIQEALMKALAARGHNVTVISTCSTKSINYTLTNYYEYNVTISNDYFEEFRSNLKTQLKNSNELSNKLEDGILGLKMNTQAAHEVLVHPVTKNLLNSSQQFDLLILGWTANDFLLGIAAHYKCPSILLYTMYSCKAIRDFVGSPSGFQYNNVAASVHQQSEITFYKRIYFALEHFIEVLLVMYLNNFVKRQQYETHFPAENGYPSYDEIIRNVSLIFVTHHFSQGGIRPSVPNLIEIGGIQLKSKPGLLPERIERFMNNDRARSHGVILFSLGTNVNVADFDNEKLSAILTVFSTLQQIIIWKWDDDKIPTRKPENVLMEKWLPQEDILAHPNTRLFISHCGLGSITEALYHGVPILAIPLFFDQHTNARKIVEERWAISLPYNTVTRESFEEAIYEILSNASYYNKVKELSIIYRDRPQSALDTAIYWTEYVIRHRGALHMQSPYVRLSFIQRNSLDVIAFYIFLFYVVFLLIKYLVQEISILKVFVFLILYICVDKFFDFLAIDLIVNAC